MGENDKAVAVYNRIVQINPGDLEANKKAKDASASATMKSGRWEEVSASSGSMNFRDLIHKKDEAIALENKSRIVRTGEQISQQITELYPQFEADQNNVDVARRIALRTSSGSRPRSPAPIPPRRPTATSTTRSGSTPTRTQSSPAATRTSPASAATSNSEKWSAA